MNTNRKAIFTLAIGDDYLKQWETVCRANWEEYGRRHGYDIIVVDKPIRLLHDIARRPLHWQKCFILSHPMAARYERVVFMDSDILINYHRAPCIVSATPAEKIGAVAFDHYLDDDLNAYLIAVRKRHFMTWEHRQHVRLQDPRPARLPPVDLAGYYKRYLPDDDGSLPRVNSGVLVLNPALHQPLLEQIYHDTFRDCQDDWVNGKEEIDQTYLTLRLLQAGLIHLLDPRFNRIASFEQAIHYPFLLLRQSEELWTACFSAMLANAYFLHFARCAEMMRYARINKEEDFAMLRMQNPFAGDIVSIRHRRSTPHRQG